MDQFAALPHSESTAPVDVSVQPADALKVKASEGAVADVPPGVVTVTLTVPSASAGLTAVIFLSLLTANEGAGTVPNSTTDAPVNPEPLIVTEVPPAVDPEVGLMQVTTGPGSYVKRSAVPTAEAPPGVETETSTAPEGPAGQVAVNSLSLMTVNEEAGTDPKLTAEAVVNPLPSTVTVVPPPAGPEPGLRPLQDATGTDEEQLTETPADVVAPVASHEPLVAGPNR